jgi:hypothetical protein
VWVQVQRHSQTIYELFERSFQEERIARIKSGAMVATQVTECFEVKLAREVVVCDANYATDDETDQRLDEMPSD